MVELLVVMGIVMILIALVLPVIQQARERARRTQCRNNLKQIGLALSNYEGAYKMFPAGWIGAAGGQHQVFGRNGFGWGPFLIPFLESNPAYNQIKPQDDLGSPANDSFRTGNPWPLPQSFVCSTDQNLSADSQWETNWNGRQVVMPVSSYVGVFGTDRLERCSKHPDQQCVGNGMFYHNSFLKVRDLRDGTAQTGMLGERRALFEEAGPWYSTWVGIVPSEERALFRHLGTGERVPNDPDTTFADFSSAHRGGAFFLMADGNVEFLSSSIDLAVFREMLTTGSTKDSVSD